MNGFFSLVKHSSNSLTRGFLVLFALALPLALLFLVLREDTTALPFTAQLTRAAAYAALVALAIVLLLLLRNYEKLLQKQRLYSLPAFAELHFDLATESYSAIVQEHSTYLLGRVGDYNFRVNLLLSSKNSVGVEVSPLVYIGQDQNLMHTLMRELQLEERLYLTRMLWLTEKQLQDPGILQPELQQLAAALRQRGVVPLGAPNNLS